MFIGTAPDAFKAFQCSAETLGAYDLKFPLENPISVAV